MGISKTEVNLKRLLAAAPRQQNQSKLVHWYQHVLDINHRKVSRSRCGGCNILLGDVLLQLMLSPQYVATLREMVEILGAEAATEGVTSSKKKEFMKTEDDYSYWLNTSYHAVVSLMVSDISISKVKLNDYSEKVEALAAQLITPQLHGSEGTVDNEISIEEEPSQSGNPNIEMEPSKGLRRRVTHHTEASERVHYSTDNDHLTPIKLDASTHVHLDRHRKLQEDMTDEMVVLAQKLKENSLMMNVSLQETEKVLDSTERAVEQSLAGTGRANARASAIYSESVKTSCFSWIVILLMTCVFVMVVLLIRVT